MWAWLVVWCWATGLVLGAPNNGGRSFSCADAQRRCIYRDGCGKALANYMLWCSDVVRGAPGCSEPCQHALIALTSTEEGKDLMNCDCNDDHCLKTKQRVEICRPHVLRSSKNETMSCRVSQLICAADTECSTALKYYQHYCRAMFTGKKCSHRCHNSISILRKQEKAEKLSNCKCDGFEDYDCPLVKSNMARLCFHQPKRVDESDTSSSNTMREDLRTNDVTASSSTAGVRTGTLLACLALVLFLVPILGDSHTRHRP